MLELKDPMAAKELSEITQRIVDRFHPDKIILYGSYAYGTPHEGSDFDLLSVISNPPDRSVVRSFTGEIKMNHPLQLVFMKTEEFEETKDVVGGLAYPAHRWGKVLHDANT